jgi:hypothetical protein
VNWPQVRKKAREGVITVLCSLSNLDDDQLKRIKSLEKELDKRLLSFTCHDIKPAELKGNELNKIQNLESELGLSLVAV